MSVCTFLGGIIIGTSGGLGFGFPAGKYFEKLQALGAAPIHYAPPPPKLILSPSPVVLVPDATIPLLSVQSSIAFWSFALVLFCLSLGGLFVAVTIDTSIIQSLADVTSTNAQLLFSEWLLEKRLSAARPRSRGDCNKLRN
jgi:hypothetical protein